MSEETTPRTEAPSREDRIGQMAYQIWEEEGRPDGKSEEHWFRACAMVDAEEQIQSEPLPTWLKASEEQAEAKTVAITPKAEEKPSLEELTRRMKSRSAA
ncbi:DUF2934 domain-containing protein [Aestuariivirga litoralis]|uniref:DUF2934 domain-containing protein n=1 Tax=Aestuariivirga litoralis TaxID=2650924 RepID=UPI0018C4CB42|nr:DUF2934 domain-containing protein [Aestuariivirga litoralis]MBG1231137.1 DUF2934 domain-containing protein [Aestuariivirga litoralis]